MPKTETVISRQDLQALPEYSLTLPTGPQPGFRWRRAVDRPRMSLANCRWAIGVAVESEKSNWVGIEWSWAVSEPGVVHRGKL